MDENIESMGEVIGSMKGPIAIYSIIGVLLLIILFLICRKTSKKNKELSRKEMTYYLDNVFNWAEPKKTLSGHITCYGDIINYSRGNRKAEFKIIVMPETFIAPCVIQNWFNGRNYNKREEDTILNDIKMYLEDNRYAKTVTILSDEEYNLQYITDTEE